MQKALMSGLMALIVLFSSCARNTSDDRPTEQTWQQTIEASQIEPVATVEEEVVASEESEVFLGDRLPDEYYTPYDPSEYTIAKGDVLEVSVLGHGEMLTQDVPVAPDGKLYFHFLDGIEAAGRTPAAVAVEIEDSIRNLFANPEVSIIPKSFTASSFVILGKVRFPGEYTIDSSVTLRQAIGTAGGFESGAYRGTSMNVVSLTDSFIIRDGKKLPIDFKRVVLSEDKDQDIYVRPGDYIYIASALNHKVYRMGALYEPRAMIWQDGMTLIGALTGHGGDDSGYLSPINTTGYEEIYGMYKQGFRNEADLKSIIILRGKLKDPHVMVVNLYDILEGRSTDIYLEPGDIVYVPERPHKFLRSLVRRAILTFAGSFGIRAGGHFADMHWFAD